MLLVNFYYLGLFIIGTFVGSFLNLVSDRLPNDEKIIFGRSKCNFCKTPLKVKNLIPLLSFIIQKAKCSFCKKKLSFFYPFSEALTGFAFMLAGYLSGIAKFPSVASFIGFIFYAVVLSFFVTMFLTDLKFCLIPDLLVIPAIIFVLVSFVLSRAFDLYNLYQRLSADPFGIYLLKAGYWNRQLVYVAKDLGYLVLSAVVISLFFLFLVWITKGRGMGVGDVKLGFLIGLVNGFPLNVVAIFLGFVIGAIYSLVLILLKKKTMKDTIAFGPFLIMGSVISLLFGAAIWNWYTQMGSSGFTLMK